MRLSHFDQLAGILVVIVASIPSAAVGQNLITGNHIGMQEVNWTLPFIQISASPDGKTFFAIDVQKGLYFWDQTTGKMHGGSISGPEWLAISNGNLMFANGGQIWEMRKLGAEGQARPADNILVYGEHCEHKWSFGGRGHLQGRHRHPITSALFFSNDKFLVTASGRGQTPGEIKIWDIQLRKEREPRIDYVPSSFFSNQRGEDILGLPVSLREAPGVETLAVSADGSTLISSYVSRKISDLGSGTAKIWDLSTGKIKGHVLIPERPILSSSAAPDAKTIAFGVSRGKAGEIVVWDVTSGKDRGSRRQTPRPRGFNYFFTNR